MLFPAHKCKNANNCWHFNIYEQENFILSSVEHEKSFITSGPGYRPYVRYILLQRNLARRVITSSTGARLAGIYNT